VPQEFEEVKHIDAFYIVCATIAIIFQFLCWRFSIIFRGKIKNYFLIFKINERKKY